MLLVLWGSGLGFRVLGSMLESEGFSRLGPQFLQVTIS